MSPEQVCPSPEYQVLQIHEYDPLLFLHFTFFLENVSYFCLSESELKYHTIINVGSKTSKIVNNTD